MPTTGPAPQVAGRVAGAPLWLCARRDAAYCLPARLGLRAGRRPNFSVGAAVAPGGKTSK
jgi:hypothetical protein